MKQVFFDAQLHNEAVEIVDVVLHDQFHKCVVDRENQLRKPIASIMSVDPNDDVLGELEKGLKPFMDKGPVLNRASHFGCQLRSIQKIIQYLWNSRSDVGGGKFNDVTGLQDGVAKIPDGGQAVQVVVMNNPDFNALVRLNSLMAIGQYIQTLWQEDNRRFQKEFNEELCSNAQRAFIDAHDAVQGLVAADRGMLADKNFDEYKEGVDYHIG